MTTDHHEFFAQYAKAYDDYDGERVASFFFCPCLVVRHGTVTLLDTPIKICDFLGTALRMYRDNGCVNFVVARLERRLLGPLSALVDVGWIMTSADGKVVMNFDTTYNLFNDNGRWKIVALTRHD